MVLSACKMVRSRLSTTVDNRLLYRLSGLGVGGQRAVSTTAPVSVALTQILCAEPLKKKKRVDPAVVRAREERRRRRLEKAIRRLEKSARQLKPISELEVPKQLREQAAERQRQSPVFSTEEANRRFDLMKAWSRYKIQQHHEDVEMYRRIEASQQRALAELKAESYQLYCDAIEDDVDLLPFTARGPTLTPPVDQYNSPDGDYSDTTRKWE